MVYITMFNLNLLPEKEKQNVVWEKCASQTLYFGSLAIVSVFIFLILLFPSYIFLALQNDDIVRNLELEKKAQETLQITTLENRIAAINAHTRRIVQQNAPSFMPGNFVEKITKLAEGRVLLAQIRYSKKDGEVRISGWAGTRNNFLDFKNTLETEGGVRNIISPINNVIKETNIQFSLDGIVQNQ